MKLETDRRRPVLYTPCPGAAMAAPPLAAILLILSGATALQLPLAHAPSGLLASWRGAAFVSRHQARGVQMNDLVLTEENVEAVLAECQVELGTLFGSNEQSRKVGITGVRH